MDAKLKKLSMDAEKLVLDLFEVEGVKFGNYTLKSGIWAPVYIDLRVVVSYPELMVRVSDLLWKTSQNVKSEYKSICGVPYTALPLATCISAKENIPMLIRRKEAKAYGTKKLIEGKYNEGDNCLIIEDVCSSGSSVLDTVQALKTSGIKVSDAIVLLDREQGAVDVLKHHGITLHSVMGLNQLIDILERSKKIDSAMVDKVRNFLQANRFTPLTDSQPSQIKKLSFIERSKLCKNEMSKKLFHIMEEKKSNLVVSADFTQSQQILELVDKVGPHVCMVKTHIDIVEDFSQDFINKLLQMAEKHKFLLFEDRKFADIGNTVKLQYNNGIYNISNWADIINAHGISGPGVLTGLKQIGIEKNKGCLLVAEMSSTGNMITADYTAASVKLAEENKDFVIGFICQNKLSDDPTLLHLTPGVQLEKGSDDLGQQYLTPEEVICKRGNDLIIVGRGITQSSDIIKTAIAYKQSAYQAYCQLLQ